MATQHPESPIENRASGAEVGMQAPDIALEDSSGTAWQLSKSRGRIVVILFYPGDETPVCTKQLCSVRDRWGEYAATGAEIVGISTDSTDSHRKFSDRHNLPLRLLADVGGEVTRAYDVRSWIPGRSARAVFVIDADGVIRYRKVQPVSLLRPKDDEIMSAIQAAQKAKGASG